MRGGQEEKKPQKMVRSSIACARCRRSKVKCKLCAYYLWDEGSQLGEIGSLRSLESIVAVHLVGT